MHGCKQVKLDLDKALPLYVTQVSAGFPSPADDYIDKRIDLNAYLIHRPHSTFLMRITGDSMIEAGIFPGALLTVDRAMTPTHNRIVVAAVNGDYTVRRLYKKGEDVKLLPANKNYQPIIVSDDLTIFGVVTSAILSFERTQ